MSLVDDTSRSDALAVLRGLLDVLANPKATRELIDRLEQAHTKADEERAAVKALKDEQEQLRTQMADEAEAHRRALSDERLKLNDEINRQRNEIAKDKAATAQAKAEQDEATRQATEKRNLWQRKVDAVDAGMRMT